MPIIGGLNKNIVAVTVYLTAVVAANIITTLLGASYSVLVAVVFIGFTMTARDTLHEAWQGKHWELKMFLLISAGAVLSWGVLAASIRISFASTVAFVASTIMDTVVYQALHNHNRSVKVNLSNMASSLVDSIVFPTIAFGAFLPVVVMGQFVAKVVGGAAWYAWIARKGR